MRTIISSLTLICLLITTTPSFGSRPTDEKVVSEDASIYGYPFYESEMISDELDEFIELMAVAYFKRFTKPSEEKWIDEMYAWFAKTYAFDDKVKRLKNSKVWANAPQEMRERWREAIWTQEWTSRHTALQLLMTEYFYVNIHRWYGSKMTIAYGHINCPLRSLRVLAPELATFFNRGRPVLSPFPKEGLLNFIKSQEESGDLIFYKEGLKDRLIAYIEKSAEKCKQCGDHIEVRNNHNLIYYQYKPAPPYICELSTFVKPDGGASLSDAARDYADQMLQGWMDDSDDKMQHATSVEELTDLECERQDHLDRYHAIVQSPMIVHAAAEIIPNVLSRYSIWSSNVNAELANVKKGLKKRGVILDEEQEKQCTLCIQAFKAAQALHKKHGGEIHCYRVPLIEDITFLLPVPWEALRQEVPALETGRQLTFMDPVFRSSVLSQLANPDFPDVGNPELITRDAKAAFANPPGKS